MARKHVSENPIVSATGGAAVPARRKSVTPKRIVRSASPVENPAVETPVVPSEPVAEILAAPSVAHSSDTVARLAYSFWEARGYQGGSPEEDWLRAERELSATVAK